MQNKAYVVANMPEKGPPRSVENRIRRSMMCLLRRGINRQSAERIAREHVEDKGYDTSRIRLVYRKE